MRIGGRLLERDRGGATEGAWRKWEALRAEIERLTAHADTADTPEDDPASPAPLWFCWLGLGLANPNPNPNPKPNPNANANANRNPNPHQVWDVCFSPFNAQANPKA